MEISSISSLKTATVSSLNPWIKSQVNSLHLLIINNYMSLSSQIKKKKRTFFFSIKQDKHLWPLTLGSSQYPSSLLDIKMLVSNQSLINFLLQKKNILFIFYFSWGRTPKHKDNARSLIMQRPDENPRDIRLCTVTSCIQFQIYLRQWKYGHYTNFNHFLNMFLSRSCGV